MESWLVPLSPMADNAIKQGQYMKSGIALKFVIDTQIIMFSKMSINLQLMHQNMKP